MKSVKNLADSESYYNSHLERIGLVTQSSIFRVVSLNGYTNMQAIDAKLQTIGGQFFTSEFNVSSSIYENISKRCTNKVINKSIEWHFKYRSIDGRGNNLKNPEWGAAGTPFSRYGPKNYEDGIYSIRKSVTGSDLPNARLLVQKVLLKAVRSPPPKVQYNLMGLLIILFATHDLHYQSPIPTQCGKYEIRCCSRERREVLPTALSNSACLPIAIPSTDPFYKNANIGCLNMVRAQLGKYSDGFQTGQIMNRATAYLDLSLIYGNSESELTPIRLHRRGKFRMGKNNLLPVDINGKYLPSMDRFISTPIGSIWPTLFARNHNHLAERLARLKPRWNDEIVFQEARRINIATFQFNLITAKSIERVFNQPITANYSDKVNVATSVEFAFTYRGAHYYTPSHMLFQSENNRTRRYLQSNTIGRIDLLENAFDDALRGALNQPVNVDQYSDEVILIRSLFLDSKLMISNSEQMVHRIGKNRQGYGMDLISMDIQRGRDHGIPSFVDIRRKCNLKPEINSFDDFNLIFNRTNVDLLKNVYESYEDVDFYVGGLLEAFESVGDPFAGPTFGCVIGANYNNVVAGDIYYYAHKENPYPFTNAQIDAIRNYQIPHIFCTNSGLKRTNKLWSYAPNSNNPKVDCKNYPPIDLTAWK